MKLLFTIVTKWHSEWWFNVQAHALMKYKQSKVNTSKYINKKTPSLVQNYNRKECTNILLLPQKIHTYVTNVHRYILFLKYFSDRKVLYDYEKYGDSPTCLNSEFDIHNKDALAQGFGVTDDKESNDKDVDGNAQLYEGKLVTVSHENCTQWVQDNAKKYDKEDALQYGNGSTFLELPQGINKQILCSRGIELENGLITVSIIVVFMNLGTTYFDYYIYMRILWRLICDTRRIHKTFS